MTGNPLVQERLYQQMFEKNSSVKLIVDPKTGAIVDVNPAASQFYGYSREHMRTMNISDINPLPHEQMLVEMDKAVREKRNFFRFNHRLASGEVRDVEVHSGRIDLGDQVYLHSVIIDVTERNRLEKELRKINAELEARIAERTQALEAEIDEHKRTMAELRKAKEMAELANRSKTEFLASVSHELRTPLNAIIGYSDPYLHDVLGGDCSPIMSQYMANIHESGLHLLEIINDILDISAIEIGKLTLHYTTIEVDHLCLSVERLIRPRADRKDLTLETDLANAPDRLFTDERRLKQILVNLLGNAVKFTPSGGTITLRIASEGDEVAVVVADTGIGMDEDGIRIALTPFGQIDNSLTRQYDGAGIGLPLCVHFAEVMGRRLDIESAPGSGTTVTVRLPTTCRT